jgi:hypothetical protein
MAIVGADATGVAGIVRIVQTARTSVAAISRTWRRSRHRMTAAALTTSPGSQIRQKRQPPVLCHPPGDGARTGSSAGTSCRFSRRAGIAR